MLSCFNSAAKSPFPDSITSWAWYDLRNDSVSVAIAPIGNFDSQTRAFLAVVTEYGERVEIAFEGDNLFHSRVVNTSSEELHQTSDYPPAPDHWRIRHDGAALWFESYDGGGPWVTEAQGPLPSFPVSRVRVEIGVESATSSASIGFGGVNTSPP